MKITSYLPLMLVPLVAACAPMMSTADDCVKAKHITITPADSPIGAVPKHICAHRGDTITVKIAGKKAQKKGSVSTTPKVAKNTWLSGSNAINPTEFVLFVNDDVKDGTYEYNVNLQSGAKLDPRVTVR